MALQSRGVMCQTCGHRAVVREGGGRGLYLLHCEACGEAKLLTSDDVREPPVVIPSVGRRIGGRSRGISLALPNANPCTVFENVTGSSRRDASASLGMTPLGHFFSTTW